MPFVGQTCLEINLEEDLAEAFMRQFSMKNRE
ncbi:uncharacterized protein METZ01_LOCUS396187 [marine metagenome]|uniref:Uncharacterized protein n=1 Tax=marine metagenome TaxID=408172 RepID=A0A382VA14_9ZZZZ